jgi:hypothetical protein
MKFLSVEESKAWWSAHPSIDKHCAQAGVARERVDANFEAKPHLEVFSAAGNVSRWLFVGNDPNFVEVREHGIWPSSENLHLYYTWRRSHADLRWLEDAPGHLFLKHEQNDCETLIQLGLLFGWGLACGSSDFGRAFHVDHDGHGLVVARNQSCVDELARLFKR